MGPYPEPTATRHLDRLLRELPPEYSSATLAPQIQTEIACTHRKVVVLDDDPTGPQAMRDVYTLTHWSIADLRRELLDTRPLFFILSNTRALPAAHAVARAREIAAAVGEAARQVGVEYSLLIRGDSTLRGHFPLEEDALGVFDGRVLIPNFVEGGRYTFDDTQWVAEDDGRGRISLTPAAQTPYARDLAFGYRHSNLHNWVAEKSAAAGGTTESVSVPLETLRTRGPDAVTQALLLSHRQTTILNAISYRDLEVAALGLLRAEQTGRRFIVRCAASFVRVRAGQSEGNSVLPESQLPVNDVAAGVASASGGLIIVGSHVPNSSAQLAVLLHEPHSLSTELDVPSLRGANAALEVARVSRWLNDALSTGQNAVIFTSREVEPRGTAAGLAMGTVIAAALVEIVRSLQLRPRFMLAKGGWTSSEIALHALGVRRAYTPSPILPGVPLWQLGPETRFPGLTFVVFPGNVGASDALLAAVRRLTL